MSFSIRRQCPFFFFFSFLLMTSSPSSSEAEVKDQDGDNNGDETDIDEILRRGFVAEEEYRPKPGFNVGRLSPNIMEHDFLNGRMTAQSAVSICESDLGCSGFTYWGSVRLANSTRGQEFDVKFFKNVDHMAKNNMFNIGWTTYKVRSRNFVVFKGRPVPKGREVEMGAKHRALVDAVKGWKKAGSKANIDWPDQSYVAFSFDKSGSAESGVLGYVEFYQGNLVEDGEWVTVLRLEDSGDFVYGHNRPVDICCRSRITEVDDYFSEEAVEMESVPCKEMTEEKFRKSFVLPGKPVKLVRCFNPDKFGDLEKLITSHKGVWDGSSSDENGKMVPFMWPLKSRSLWARIEKSYADDTVQAATSSVPDPKGIKGFRFPSFLPKDLWNLHEVEGRRTRPMRLYYGSGKTGVPPHIEGQVRSTIGAQLVGRRWWAVLPVDTFTGSDAHYCSKKCSYPSPTVAVESLSSAAIWFQHVLPQIQKLSLYGHPLVQTRQNPGDIVYVPGRCPFSYYNEAETLALTEEVFTEDSLDTAAGIRMPPTESLKNVIGEKAFERYEANLLQIQEEIPELERRAEKNRKK